MGVKIFSFQFYLSLIDCGALENSLGPERLSIIFYTY